MFLDEVISVLEAAGVGQYGTDIFKSSMASIPDDDGPYLSITETGGSKPVDLLTHNAVSFGLPAYVSPTAQLMSRGRTEPAARAMIQSAYAAISRVGQKSQLVAGVWWVKAGALQEPFDFGLDDIQRICFVFNISVDKRPNAAMSQ